MTTGISKRLLAFLAALLVLAAACAEEEETPVGQEQPDLTPINVPMLVFPSMSSVLIPIIEDQGLAEKHGFELSITEIAEFGAYYATLATAQVDALQGGPIVAQNMRLEGVPIRIGGTAIDLKPMVVVSNDPDVSTIEDLEGNILAAPAASSEYQILSIYANSRGLRLEDDVTVRNVDPPVVEAELERGRVSAGLMWEPSATLAIERHGFEIVARGDEMWETLTNERGWDLVWIFHDSFTERYPDAPERWMAVVQEAAQLLVENREEVAGPIADKTGFPEDSLFTVLDAELMIFDPRSVSEPEVRQSLTTMFQLAVAGGYSESIPEDFFVPTDTE